MRKIGILRHSQSLPKIRGLLNKTRNFEIPNLSKKSVLKGHTSVINKSNINLPTLEKKCMFVSKFNVHIVKIKGTNSFMSDRRRKFRNKSEIINNKSLSQMKVNQINYQYKV